MRKFLQGAIAWIVVATLLLAPIVTAQPVVLPRPMVTTTASVSSATTLFTWAGGAYTSAQFAFTSVGSGNQYIVEQSPDNTNWYNAFGTTMSGAGGWGNGASAPSASVVYSLRMTMPYYRLRISSYSSGTITGFLTLSNVPNDTAASIVSTANASSALFIRGRLTTVTDRSSTITTGGTSQQAAASNTSRTYLMCQNIDTAIVEDLWLNIGATAAANTAGSIRLAPGASITFEGTALPQDAINVVAATTGHRYTCKEIS